MFVRMRLDGFSDGWEAPRVFSQVAIGVLLLMSIMLSAAFLARHLYSRWLLCYFGFLLLMGFAAIRSYAGPVGNTCLSLSRCCRTGSGSA